MRHKPGRKRPSQRKVKSLERFLRDDDGSFTIEAVIWMPIFAIILALIFNISMVFFTESQLLRIVQDANRAFSLGRLDDTTATENYITNALAYLDTTVAVTTTLDGGIISTVLNVPAVDLMPMSFMRDQFRDIAITVRSQQLVEF